ncbi:Trypsin-like peptidase domain containing protein [Candidatus Hepatincola sp. Pdp]
MKFVKKSLKYTLFVALGGIIVYGFVWYFSGSKLDTPNNLNKQDVALPESALTNKDSNNANNLKEANFGDNSKVYNKSFAVAEGFANLVEYVTPSVVNISSIKVVKTQGLNLPIEDMDPRMKELFKNMIPQPDDQKEQRFLSLGSGFIIRSDGFIVTNNHVVQSAESVRVTLHDGKKLPATVYATDPMSDIALLKVNAKDLPTLSFGDSSKVRPGDWVISIGNPFGLGGTVSAGIVSAIARDINIGRYNDFIQTDAAINKGNSGGPMINTKGEIIGINTAIISTSGGGSIGIGFAVPSNVVKQTVAQLLLHKKVIRGWLGVQIQELTPSMAKSLGLKNIRGVLVASVIPNSPAAKAGIIGGDIIMKINNVQITDSKLLPKMVSNMSPGSTIKATLLSNKKVKEVNIQITEIPSNVIPAAMGNQDGKQNVVNNVKKRTYEDIGIQVADLNDRVRTYFKLDKNSKGVIILGVKQDSIAKQKGLGKGLRIISVNQELVKDLDSFDDLITKYKAKGLVFLIEDVKKNRIFISISNQEIKTGFPEEP